MPAQPHPALRLAPVCADAVRAVLVEVGLSSWRAAGASSEGHIVRLVCSHMAYAAHNGEPYRGRPVHASPSAGGDMFQSQASSACPGTPPPAHRDWCRLQACDLVRQKQRRIVQ